MFKLKTFENFLSQLKFKLILENVLYLENILKICVALISSLKVDTNKTIIAHRDVPNTICASLKWKNSMSTDSILSCPRKQKSEKTLPPIMCLERFCVKH